MKLLSLSPLSLLMTVMIGVTYAYDTQLPKLRGAAPAQEQYLEYGNDDSIYGYPPSCRSDADCHGGDYCCPFHGDYSFCRARCNRSTNLTSALSELHQKRSSVLEKSQQGWIQVISLFRQ